MASERQISYINSLAEQKDLTNLDPEINGYVTTPMFLEHADNATVSIILEHLKALPFKPKEPDLITALGQSLDKSELALLEEKTMKGHYFIVDPTDGVEKFFKVEKPEPPSRWSGYTFIKVQASDLFYPIKNNEHKVAILKTIAIDPVTAMNEYGIRLGVCGLCGRTLTARGSRLKGIGPICEEYIFMEQNQATDEQKETLRKLGLI